MLAYGTPDAVVDGYWQAKQAAGPGSPGGKTRVWEEFDEEEDYRSASKKFWQTIRRLRRGKQCSTNTVYSVGDMPSTEEAEAEDSEVDSSVTQAEVTKVVRKLLCGKALGVDEIRLEYLKSLDDVGLSWLTRLCNIALGSGTVPLE
ncbi:hypothetical protein L3Q82_002045 [Scortum barcoo]|uniref:Uncharacterized protein n=1 Tax=Scortum barcoo TaxID=214431 RepID=A0ACB8W2M2_9TELE|nr:hypothetical protein L3Q82_002045 [Scortum barcoo]